VRRRAETTHYLEFLKLLQVELRPRVYVEIGIRRGDSLALATVGSAAYGIDPNPQVRFPLVEGAQVFAVTSDEFFEGVQTGATHLSGPVDLAFIDGLHHFEVALRDFMNVERLAHAGSVIVMHDCLPSDAETSTREETVNQFWTGDVWKASACLREYRPDLRITTVDVPPSGLAIVTGLDPTSDVLASRYSEIVAKYMPMGWDDYTNRAKDVTLVPPSWQLVQAATGAKPFRPTSKMWAQAERAYRLRRHSAAYEQWAQSRQSSKAWLRRSPAGPLFAHVNRYVKSRSGTAAG
jgi:hypothetical protein